MAEARADIHHHIESDLRFHVAVTKAAHNRYFEMVLDPLVHVFLQQISLTDAFSLGLDQHRAVFDAIRQANPVAARQAVRRLMRSTAADLRRALTLLSPPNTRLKNI